MDKIIKFSKEVIEEIIKENVENREQINNIKMRIAEKYKLKEMPSNADILKYANPTDERIRKILLKKPVRSASGVAVVALMVKPHKCPGKCIYCPNPIEKKSPKSYTGHEPAAMRAIQFNFSPKEQIRNRIGQLKEMGHSTDKIEMIIMGGCFLAMSEKYQNWFVKSCLDEINNKESKNLREAKLNAEHSKRKLVGLTIETRPDYCKKYHIKRILNLGATRVELGVQMPSDLVYKKVRRGHKVEHVIEATRLLKDSALKVCYHIMPGIYGIDIDRQMDLLKSIFEEDDFKPDMLKIYPCLVIKNTKLYDLWKEGKYKPLNDEEAAEFIAELKKYVPKWVRIMRVQRDIPAKLITAGVKKSNLRQLVEEKMKEKNIMCNCIRHREIGIREIKKINTPQIESLRINKIEYDASKGKEFFIEAVDKEDSLYGFLRLRIPYEPFVKPLNRETALIRELHVYGSALPIGIRKEDAIQHRGIGKMLMQEAEEIATEKNMESIAIISALGVREYYKKYFGYEKKGVYMWKKIT
ncbi:MAG: tRNA uridine(34) 5-carboxymethylaminomethyl modification radical SAM/GNAT enzyme Elp3 [Candidatus Diapherotrites archaeon]|nr:tRNA uridine(34) 5-carboxymethylaminomethyl modification radical SAM/GNAT enzyme Elp3 [Candidatus Diapherotrites archaeon]